MARAINSAGIPVAKEPSGLSRNDGKRPDGLTLVPWQNGKALTWDVTVATTLANSYLTHSSNWAGSAAELSASKKVDKYSSLPSVYMFQPIALEILDPVSSTAEQFINEVGRRISVFSGEPKKRLFLWQRLSCACSAIMSSCCINLLLKVTVQISSRSRRTF